MKRQENRISSKLRVPTHWAIYYWYITIYTTTSALLQRVDVKSFLDTETHFFKCIVYVFDYINRYQYISFFFFFCFYNTVILKVLIYLWIEFWLKVETEDNKKKNKENNWEPIIVVKQYFQLLKNFRTQQTYFSHYFGLYQQ